MKKEYENVIRKKYDSPKLHEYGNIREITLAVGNTGNTDNGTGKNKKTRV